MKRMIFIFALICISIGASTTFAQNTISDKSEKVENTTTYELLENKEKIVKVELRNLREIYTEISSNVQNKKFELNLVGIEKAKLLLVDSSKFCRLNETYGDMVLSKVALEVELKQLLVEYTPQSPIVIKTLTNLADGEQKVMNYLLK